MKKSGITDEIITNYNIDKKYYCSKCKFYKKKQCTRNRATTECRKKRLKNV